MTKEANKLSRRDWFRLRVPRENKMLSEPNAAVETDSLKPIEHPPNHDGLDLSSLPPMSEATLSHEQVESLFADIKEFAADIQLMQRSTSASRATAARIDVASQLTGAHDALISGRVAKLQIRYRWQDSLWIDTLETQDAGFRLVRISHQQV